MPRDRTWPLLALVALAGCVDLAAPQMVPMTPGAGAGAGGADGVVDAPTDRPKDAARARLGIGIPCSQGAQCDSTLCVDGVCCNVACDGVCQACDVPNAVGTCTPVPTGDDPANECQRDEPTGCKQDGACDGAGGCRLHPQGTVCEPATCTDTTLTSARTCDGTGTCQESTTASCGSYRCGAGACRDRCANPDDCVAPYFCQNSSCSGPKPPGSACTATTECASGFCEQGFCCTSGCRGTCRSCALPGKLGTCSAVAAGQDPLAQCADKGAASCGNDGACDGAGKCRNHAAGTVCVAGSCVGSTLTPSRTCDGSGLCRPQAPASSCAPYTCDSGLCRRKCKDANDCVSGSTCASMTCS